MLVGLVLFGCRSKEVESALIYINQQNDWDKAMEQLKTSNFKELLNLTINGLKVVLSADSKTEKISLLMESFQETPLNKGQIAFYLNKKDIRILEILLSELLSTLKTIQNPNNEFNF
jgi:flagellar biosynthesis/type III secretory pathway protein FliH